MTFSSRIHVSHGLLWSRIYDSEQTMIMALGGVPYSPAPLAGCPLLPSLEPGLFTATRNTIPSGCVDLLLAGVQRPGTFLAPAAGAPAPLHRIDTPAAIGAAKRGDACLKG